MKLAISNIAWENDQLDEHLLFIKTLGCHGVEIAPSCIWPEPIESSKRERKELKKKIENFGLQPVGLHALLYSRPELKLFDTAANRVETREYLKCLFEVCGDMGGKTLVLGSPRNRARGDLPYDKAFAIAVDFFKELAVAAYNQNVTLCIEPLSEKEADFIQTSQEGANLVNAVNHPCVSLHLDAKALMEAEENIDAAIGNNRQIMRHFHISDSGLLPPGTSGFDHRRFGNALREAEYCGFGTIEMRRGSGPSKDVIEKTVRYVFECYPVNYKENTSVLKGE